MAGVVLRPVDVDARCDDVPLDGRRAGAAPLGAAAAVLPLDLHRRVRLVLRCEAYERASAAAQRAVAARAPERLASAGTSLGGDSDSRARIHGAGDAMPRRVGPRPSER